MKKFTVRTADETADGFRAVCKGAGVSLQGCLGAHILNMVEWFEEQHHEPPERWRSDNPELLHFWLLHVETARELDAERRARS